MTTPTSPTPYMLTVRASVPSVWGGLRGTEHSLVAGVARGEVNEMPMYTPITEEAVKEFMTAQELVVAGRTEEALPLLQLHYKRLEEWDQWRKDFIWELNHGERRAKQTA